MGSVVFLERLRQRNAVDIFYIILIVLSIIELAISAFLVANYNKFYNFPSIAVLERSRFLLFASTWTLLLAIYFLAGIHWFSHSALAGTKASLIGISITWVFWLAGAASLTDALGGSVDCGVVPLTYCDQLNALDAFSWIIWVLLTVALFIIGAIYVRSAPNYNEPLIV